MPKRKTAGIKERAHEANALSEAPRVATIGHSTRSLADFIELLKAHGIRCLVDVRTIPKSRRNPQFNQDTFREALRAQRIRYVHLAGLGGLRHPRRDSPNVGWRNASFRGFADYMQTSEFDRALGKLIELASRKPSAIMCAEAVPWRCHRSLIADALLARGIETQHILSTTQARPHRMTPWAKIQGGRLTYPAEPAALFAQKSKANESRLVRQKPVECRGRSRGTKPRCKRRDKS